VIGVAPELMVELFIDPYATHFVPGFISVKNETGDGAGLFLKIITV